MAKKAISSACTRISRCAFDNWDVDIYYTEKYWDVNDVISMEWTECGPVRATLEMERKESNSVIHQKIHFYADSRRIEFETYVDWKEHQTLLKVHFRSMYIPMKQHLMYSLVI